MCCKLATTIKILKIKQSHVMVLANKLYINLAWVSVCLCPINVKTP